MVVAAPVAFCGSDNILFAAPRRKEVTLGGEVMVLPMLVGARVLESGDNEALL